MRYYFFLFRRVYWGSGEGEDGPAEDEVWPHHSEAGGGQGGQGKERECVVMRRCILLVPGIV